MSKRPAKPGLGDRIEIAAAAERVWAIVADLEGWGTWNPLYTAVRGRAELGASLAMTIALEGMKPQQATARVVTVQRGALLEYEVVNLGGLVRAFRFIEIESLGPGRCAVANYEIMSGLLGNLLVHAVGAKVAKGLAAMNTALKTQAERA